MFSRCGTKKICCLPSTADFFALYSPQHSWISYKDFKIKQWVESLNFHHQSIFSCVFGYAHKRAVCLHWWVVLAFMPKRSLQPQMGCFFFTIFKIWQGISNYLVLPYSWGGDSGSPNFPLPIHVPFNPGSRPFFWAFAFLPLIECKMLCNVVQNT